MTVFSGEKPSTDLFFGNPVSLARYDQLVFPAIDKLTEKQMGFFWQPTEVDCTKDGRDFKLLSPHEQHIFTSNLKRQILLDSVQGRAPVLAFLPVVSVPELENWIITWSFFETIHSRSYSHIIRNIYNDPSKVFDEIINIKEIYDCAEDISVYYDMLIEMNTNAVGVFEDLYAHKKDLWMALMAVCALEGIRFYVSFACSWAFAEVKKMEGNAKIIKFIARDENLHLAAVQQIMKFLAKNDKDFAKIKDETVEECTKLYMSVMKQEKEWAKYLFKDGSMIGLNADLLTEFIEHRGGKIAAALGLDIPYNKNNPLPWTQKWIAGDDVQVAPQEVEISSYIIGGVNMDVTDKTLKGLKL